MSASELGPQRFRGPLVFGMVDGVTLVLGLLLGMVISRQPNASVWHAALGGGLAELGGMGLGQYWAEPEAGKLSAAANGVGCCVSTILCGVPFAVTRIQLVATVVSCVLIFSAAVLICILREETGKMAVLRTFGLLAVAGTLSGVSGLI